MNKQQILKRVEAQFRELLELTVSASQEARDEATDEESRAESKYDTHAIEASYLAAGQAERAEELALTIQTFAQTRFPDFAPGDPIAVGALVDVDFGDERCYFLLAAAGGGTTSEVDGRELTVLAPSAPLARKLMGAKAGDVLKDPPLKIMTVL
jgi:transcription elongation GreA/GreB family factor